jgi:hypothetical protein
MAMAAFATWMTSYFGVSWADFGIYFIAGMLMQAYPGVVRRAPLIVAAGITAPWRWPRGGAGDRPNHPGRGQIWLGNRIGVACNQQRDSVTCRLGTFLWHAPILHFISGTVNSWDSAHRLSLRSH